MKCRHEIGESFTSECCGTVQINAEMRKVGSLANVDSVQIYILPKFLQHFHDEGAYLRANGALLGLDEQIFQCQPVVGELRECNFSVL